MIAPRQIRIAVGSPTGRRSTVWKFTAHKNDVYILSRMFGSDTKVSLHSSGSCQWSGTDRWVLKAAGRKNAERHITKWEMPRPSGTAALHVFQIRIPETELRPSELGEDLTNVKWLPVPPLGHTVSLECYFTPVSEADPAHATNLPYPRLFSLRMPEGRWFIVLYDVVPLNGNDLNQLRSEMNARAKAATGADPNPAHRAAVFTVGEGTARGLIELCTVGV